MPTKKRLSILRTASLTTYLVFQIVTPSATQSAIDNQQSEMTSTAIIGATLIDGSGRRPISDSVVLLRGDTLLEVGRRGQVKIPAEAKVLNASGLVLAPGFIDTHNHSERGLVSDPSAASQVSQGISTIAVGQDGGSEFPIETFLQSLDKNPVALNVLTFVGHATLRSKVFGEDTNRQATPTEIQEMRSLVEQAMREGAFGLSTGLEYETGKPATTEEIISLARVAAQFEGIYISHIRDEADKTFEALAEAIQIGREAKLPVQISHIKLGTKAVWGRAAEVVSLINKARRRGQDITADCYPYDAWSSTIRVLIPSGRHFEAADVARGLEDVGGPANITIVSCRAHPDYEFKTMDEIARKENISPVELYMKIVRDGGAGVVCRSMIEPDIKTFYLQPWVMVSSDGGINARHPRGAGSFPRVLGRYVRERGWLSLPEAIRKMTSLPAARLRLADRGLVRPGLKADLVLFDPQQLIDRATFEQPTVLSEGIKRVLVNGIEVWRDGSATGKRPGRAIRHQLKKDFPAED